MRRLTIVEERHGTCDHGEREVERKISGEEEEVEEVEVEMEREVEEERQRSQA
jgi:hypothetical protein